MFTCLNFPMPVISQEPVIQKYYFFMYVIIDFAYFIPLIFLTVCLPFFSFGVFLPSYSMRYGHDGFAHY